MSWLGDVGSFELFNLKGMANQVKDNPARLLYGSADPFSTKMWNGILGTNDKPLIDQWGGAAEHRYQEAEDAGINTGPGKTAHGVAKVIAGIFAGGGLLGGGQAAAGAGSAAGAGGAGGIGAAGASAAPAASAAGGTGYGLGQSLVSGGVGNASYAGGSAAASPGFLSQVGSAYNSAKPYIEAYQTGSQLLGQGRGQQQPGVQAPAPVTPTPGGGTEALAQLGNQSRVAQNAMLQNASSAREQRRMNRRGLLS